MNPFITQLAKYGPVSADLENELLRAAKIVTKPKGAFFLKKGQVASSLFLIESGLVRAYYELNDRELNVWFGFERIILGSVMPLFYNRPAIENIQCLEETTLFYIPGAELNNLYSRFEALNTIGRRLTEEYAMILEDRAFSLQAKTAEERYLDLLRDHPDALKRIALGHIASYLGITQETLSRIRKRISFD